MKKILFATLAVSAFATSAMAAPRYHAQSANQAITNDTVVSDGVVIGKDPDGYVRLEMLRTAASPNQG